jgi:2-polyprenyl-3-methyl-5-hydroxy-6-metoxy-1,4-benzoquinol methylase
LKRSKSLVFRETPFDKMVPSRLNSSFEAAVVQHAEMGQGSSRYPSSGSVLEERAFPGLHASLIGRIGHLELDANTAILDLGCGSGAWLERLSLHGFTNLSGVDIDPSGFGAHMVADFHKGDVTSDLEFAREKFGLITAIEIVEHLSNPERLFWNAAQHLSNAGWFLLTTPNIYSVQSRALFLLRAKMRGFDPFEDRDHVHPLLLLPLEEIILPRYGLTLVEKWSYPEGSQISKRARPRSHRLVRAAVKLVSLVLPNDLPGDALCLLMRKA